jgi:hypothetical protein
VVLVWLGWAELREVPGIEPLAEWLEEITTPIPTCGGQDFCVAVADLQNDPDDKFGGEIVDAVENLQDIANPPSGGQDAAAAAGIEVIRIPRTISIAGNNTRTAEADAVVKARHYLEKSRADLIVWGIVVAHGEKNSPRLFWTTSEANQRASNLLDTEGIQLPGEFWQQLASMLQLVVVTKIHKWLPKKAGMWRTSFFLS